MTSPVSCDSRTDPEDLVFSNSMKTATATPPRKINS